MNFDEKTTLYANKWIVEKKLVELTWGNVSCFDRKNETIYIKPSGVSLEDTTEEDISGMSYNGYHLFGKKPSVDTPTHLEIYARFPKVNCVIHTNSKYATIFAQAGMSIPCLGTTHADYFYGEIPCVDNTNPAETKAAYEECTGERICRHFKKNKIDPLQVGACLVNGHGVFSWDSTVERALERAYVLEIVAEMAFKTLMLNKDARLDKFILDKHFLRKHGEKKYYGQ